jgi:phosphoglycolate phosphatase
VATVIGFDLDMTLVDSRQAIIGALAEVCSNRGIEHSDEELASRIGLPLLDVLAALAPGFDPEIAATEYRAHYGRVGLDSHTALPGATAAVDRVRAAGGAVVVVTGKREDQARLVLETVGLEIEHVIGSVFGAGKGPSLTRLGATAYVGDHPGDIAGARQAQVVSVAVATGMHDSESLTLHGADIVLSDLREFPTWFDSWHDEVPAVRH